MATTSTISTAKTLKTDVPVYAGSELISFAVSEMPPSIRIYSYVNGVNVTNFTGPVTTGALIADPIITDQLGTAVGYLYIPSTEGQYKFLSGEIRITFGDSPNGVADCKYISETVLMNHGLNLVDTEQGGTISLRRTEKFRTDNTGSSGDASTTTTRLDPLSQTFSVDESAYPLGLVLTGIALFVSAIDDKFPLGVELRPMSGGAPSTTEYFSGTSIFIAPANIPAVPVPGQNYQATNFTFDFPVYLKPGEYAFCVVTKSSKYTLLSAKRGDGKIVKNPFAGKLFKAQNTGNWVGDDNEDLTFYLRKAKFETGTSTFELISPDIKQIDYNRIRLLSTDIALGDTAFAEYKIVTTNDSTNREQNDAKVINAGDALDIAGRQSTRDQGDIKLQISITTKSQDVSPILDKQLIKSQVFRTNITPYTTNISDSELNSNNGDALARYISKVVTLTENLDSTGLEVRMEVNRKIGSDIEVFARVISRNDKSYTAGIASRPWTRVPLALGQTKSFAGTDDAIFTQEIYKLLEPGFEYTVNKSLSDTEGQSTSYDDFFQYQIKVVFYASNPVYLPKIRKLIATSLIA
jgi:hypothetical protein